MVLDLVEFVLDDFSETCAYKYSQLGEEKGLLYSDWSNDCRDANLMIVLLFYFYFFMKHESLNSFMLRVYERDGFQHFMLIQVLGDAKTFQNEGCP